MTSTGEYTEQADGAGQRRTDLDAFIGPRVARFQRLYDKRAANSPKGVPLFLPSWNWPVFFLSFTWFFYRKMHIVGTAMMMAPFFLSKLAGYWASGLFILVPVFANAWYLRCALGRIAKADQLGLEGEARGDYLRRAGGTSPLAAGIAGFILFATITLRVAAALARLRVDFH